MPYTREDLVRTVADELGVTEDGQPPTPEDAAKIRRALPGIAADLDIREIASFPDLESVPDAAAGHFAVIVASTISGQFGLSSDEITVLEQRSQGSQQKLRAQRTMPYSGAPVRACYF